MTSRSQDGSACIHNILASLSDNRRKWRRVIHLYLCQRFPFCFVQEWRHLVIKVILPVCSGLWLKFKLVWCVFAQVSPVTCTGLHVYLSEWILQQWISCNSIFPPAGVVLSLRGLVSRLHVIDYFATLEAHTQRAVAGHRSEQWAGLTLRSLWLTEASGLRSAEEHWKTHKAIHGPPSAQNGNWTADKLSATGHVLKCGLRVECRDVLSEWHIVWPLWDERKKSTAGENEEIHLLVGFNSSPTPQPTEPAIDLKRHVPWIHVCSHLLNAWGWLSLKLNLGTSTNIFFFFDNGG